MDGVTSPGDQITYTYIAHNTGDAILTNVTVTEQGGTFSGTGILPVPVFQSSSMGSPEGTLMVGETAEYTAVYVVTQDDISAAGVTNQALAQATVPNGDPVDDLSDDDSPLDGEDNPTETPLDQGPSIYLVKGSNFDVGIDGIATPGDVITYSYTVFNAGNVTLTNVTVTEQGGTFTGTGILPAPAFQSSSQNSVEGTLLPGENATYTATYAITADDIISRQINNQALASGTPPAGPDVTDLSDSSNPNDPNETGTPSDPMGNDPTGTDMPTTPIVANDDDLGPVNGIDGNPNVGNAFNNDTLNGDPVDPADITATVTTPATPINGGPVPELDPVTGTVSVPAGTPVGTYIISYQICEDLNPGNCDGAEITVTIDPAPIVANDDDLGPVNGTDGNPNVGNAFNNDTLNGDPVDPADITATVTTPATPINGGPVPELDPVTGTVSVPAGTPVGTYTIAYEICEVLNPGNCDGAEITVTVVTSTIVANEDDFGPVNGLDGDANVGNAFDNDTLNGDPVDVDDITATVSTPATPINGGPVPALDPATGTVSVPTGTPAGTYTIAYEICEDLNPENCDGAEITVTVEAATIIANEDNYGPLNGLVGDANVGNAFDNDTLNGDPVDVDDITATVTTPATPVNGGPVPALDPITGIVSVPVGTPAGTYTIIYQICENLNPTNCDGAAITVTVAPPPIVDLSGNGQFTAPDCAAGADVIFSGNIYDSAISVGDDLTGAIEITGANLVITNINVQEGFAYFEATGTLAPGTYLVEVAYGGVTADHLLQVVQGPNSPAVITMPGNLSYQAATCTTEVPVSFSVQITDDCDTDLSGADFTVNGAPAPAIDAVASDPVNGLYVWNLSLNAGTYLIEALYMDGAGNFTNAQATITVTAAEDNFAPVIIHPSQNQTVTLDPCGPAEGEVSFNISAYDDCDGDIAPVVTATGGTLSQDGNTWTLELAANTCEVVTITATDMAGNTRTESFQTCAQQAPRPVDNLACEDNLFITLDENCERQLTAEMLLEGNSGCLTEADFIIDVKSFSGQLLNSDGILPGTGQYIYDIRLAPGAPADATFEGCWGFVTGEDKTAPAIDCPPDTGTGTIVKNGYQLSGEIDNTDPTIVIEDHSCLIDNTQPNFPGERYVDVQSFQVDRNDIYTFLVESDVTNLGNVGFAIYQGSFDIDNPCENIIAQSDIPLGTGSPLPGAQTNDPFIRLSLPLQAGELYFIATTTFEPGATGTYDYSICADGNGRVGFFDTTVIVNPDWTETTVVNFTPLPTAPVEIELPLLCGDLALILNNPASLAITGSPDADDACSPVTTVFTDTYAQSGDCGDIVITRTFTTTDATGRTATCEQLITLRNVEYSDIYLPPFTAPIECDEDSYETLANGNPAPSATGYPFVFTASGIFDLSDSYCNVGASFEDGTRIDVCEGAYKFVRTWTIIDWCNPIDFFTYPQIIKVGDFTAPEVQCPVGAPLAYSTSPFACAAAFEVPMPVVSDNCSSTSVLTEIVTMVEEEILTHWGAPTGEFTVDTIVVRTVQPEAGRFVTGIPVGSHFFRYTVADACGNKTVVHCPFEVADQIAPVAVCDDELNISVGGATATGEALARITAADVDEGSWDNCELASIDISREITDDCISTYAQEVNHMSWPADYRNVGPGSGFDEVFVSRIDVPERGIVANQPLIGRKGGILYSFWSNEAFFTCCDVGTELKVELRATDAAGNENICWLVTTPEDKLRPICVAPANVTIDCEELPLGFDVNDEGLLNDLFGTAEGFDNCSIETIEQTGASADLECRAGAIVRTFRVTDHGGLTATCSQTIIVSKSHNYEIKFPKDAEAVCGVAEPDSVIYNEIGCDLLAVSHTDELFQASGDECYKIFRTWRVINWCEYDGQSDPIVLGRDENCSGTPGDDCFWLLRRPNGKVYIDKDTDETPGNNVPGFNPCNFQVRDFYRKFESNRGFWQYTQHIKVYDDIAPAITFDAADPFCSLNNVDCDALVTFPFTVDEECTPDDLTITVSLNAFLGGSFTPLTGVLSGTFPNYTISGRFPIGNHAFRVTASDGCGNSIAAVLPFSVIDCKAPTPICINGLAVELMPVDLDGDNLPDPCVGMAEIWASDFLVSPNNDCTGPIKYSINLSGEANDPNNQGLFFDCEDEGSVVVEIWAYDAAGNGDFCETYVLVQDNMGVCTGCDPSPGIAGAVRTEPGQDEPVEDVEVKLSGQMSDMMTTGSDGLYGFSNLQAGMDYTVTPQRDGDYLNGVSTFDLVLINKHILGVELLGSPYKRIAADVNRSGTITTLDMIQLRKLILSIDLVFSNNTSWRFVDAAYVFPDPSNPWAEPFPEVININDLPGSGIGNANFVAVKIGDVNGDARPNSFAPIDDRSADKVFALSVAEDVAMKAGNEYSVVFTAADLAGIEGYQATLTLGKAVELVDIVNGIAVEEHFGLAYVGEGMITTSWHGDAGDGNLFTLVLRAKADAQLSEVLGVSSAITKAEAYGKDGSFQDVAIVFGNGTVASLGFELYQNMPNPFKSETAIGFKLPEAGSATLTVSDLSGRVLKQYKIDAVKGYNELMLRKGSLPNGLLQYTLRSGEHTATKRMVVME